MALHVGSSMILSMLMQAWPKRSSNRPRSSASPKESMPRSCRSASTSTSASPPTMDSTALPTKLSELTSTSSASSASASAFSATENSRFPLLTTLENGACSCDRCDRGEVVDNVSAIDCSYCREGMGRSQAPLDSYLGQALALGVADNTTWALLPAKPKLETPTKAPAGSSASSPGFLRQEPSIAARTWGFRPPWILKEGTREFSQRSTAFTRPTAPAADSR
mmetsp:Transcript_73446/g.175108  ORF Transcript_73446/g.175108 Transcript_73446/m.175108 type:complete len:222 (+) Transcript_73446:3402-4067(+)